MNSYIVEKQIYDLYNLELYIIRGGLSVNSITSNGVHITVNSNVIYTSANITLLNSLVNSFRDSREELSNSTKFISMTNATSTPLGPWGVFEGMYEDISGYSTVSITCLSDTNGILEVIYSNDAINIHKKDTYIIISNESLVDIKTIVFKHYKIKYTAGYMPIGNLLDIGTLAHISKCKDTTDSTVKSYMAIQEEDIPTGGHFRAESRQITILGNSTKIESYTWPYRTSVLVMKFVSDTQNTGDLINFYVGKHTNIGVIIANSLTNATSITVSKTVVDNIKIGFLLTLQKTTGEIFECGEVYNIVNNVVSFTIPLNQDFHTGDYVQMTVQPVRNYIISTPWLHVIGDSKIGSSSIPPNTLCGIEYTNNTSSTKTFLFSFEYLY
jgi:hypothetical protein